MSADSKLRSHYISYALMASVVYLIPTCIFLFGNSNEQFWLPYLGNFLLFICIVACIKYFNIEELGNHGNIRSLFFTGFRTTLIAVAVTTVVTFIIAAVKYGYFEMKTDEVEQAAQSATGNSMLYSQNETGMMIIVNALIVNFIMGMLGSFIGASVVKRNQQTAKGRELV